MGMAKANPWAVRLRTRDKKSYRTVCTTARRWRHATGRRVPAWNSSPASAETVMLPLRFS